jgi:hypothetical protein
MISHKITNFTLLIIASFCLTACTINASFRGLFSYYKTTKKESPHLLSYPKNTTEVCAKQDTAAITVVVVNGLALKECIKQHDKAILYEWAANCHSPVCYPLEAVQRACNEKNIPLYIVAQYYETAKMSKKYDIAQPIYGIDVKYYKTNLTKKYLTRFYKDLGISYTIELGRINYFEKGEYVCSFSDIDSIGADFSILK